MCETISHSVLQNINDRMFYLAEGFKKHVPMSSSMPFIMKQCLVFSTEAEYSYFYADFRLTSFLLSG